MYGYFLLDIQIIRHPLLAMMDHDKPPQDFYEESLLENELEQDYSIGKNKIETDAKNTYWLRNRPLMKIHNADILQAIIALSPPFAALKERRRA